MALVSIEVDGAIAEDEFNKTMGRDSRATIVTALVNSRLRRTNDYKSKLVATDNIKAFYASKTKFDELSTLKHLWNTMLRKFTDRKDSFFSLKTEF